MFDTLSSIPLWGVALLYAVVGAAVGVVLARRRYSRPVSFALLLTVAVVAAGASSVRWDRNTRTTPLGGSADSEKRFGLEAFGRAQGYTDWRRRWMGMSDAERRAWRLTMFGVVSVSILTGGVPTLLWMNGRASRVPGQAGHSL